jgi:hypothetical protein
MRTEAERTRVIVGGTRTLEDWRLVYRKLDYLLKKLHDPLIVVGAGVHKVYRAGKDIKVGADHHAEQWAYSRYKTVVKFAPEGRAPAAFHIRNREMVEYAKAGRRAFAVFFWDGKSPGTKEMIGLCKKAKIQNVVVRY